MAPARCSSRGSATSHLGWRLESKRSRICRDSSLITAVSKVEHRPHPKRQQGMPQVTRGAGASPLAHASGWSKGSAA